MRKIRALVVAFGKAAWDNEDHGFVSNRQMILMYAGSGLLAVVLTPFYM